MCGGLRGPMDRVQSVSSSKALVIRARTIEALAGGSPGQGAPALSDRLRFLRVVPDEADQECEDHAADRAAADVPDPALDRLSRDRADELADDAAADCARNRVAQCADRIVLGRGACRAAADRARNDLNEKTGEIHFCTPLLRRVALRRPTYYALGAHLLRLTMPASVVLGCPRSGRSKVTPAWRCQQEGVTRPAFVCKTVCKTRFHQEPL